MKVALQTCTWNELIVDGERAQITGRRINPAKCCDESASWQRTVWLSRLDSEQSQSAFFRPWAFSLYSQTHGQFQLGIDREAARSAGVACAL
jgi:hypothetical protein